MKKYILRSVIFFGLYITIAVFILLLSQIINSNSGKILLGTITILALSIISAFIASTKKLWWLENKFNPKDFNPKDPDVVHYWTLAVHRIILIVSILTFIGTIGLLIYAIRDFDLKQEQLVNLLDQPRITRPANGATVKDNGRVEGYTPYKNSNIYILVTDPTGAETVQGPVSVSANGIWSGNASYGINDANSLSNFYVRALITMQKMKPGDIITVLPDDAIVTNSIMVTRNK